MRQEQQNTQDTLCQMYINAEMTKIEQVNMYFDVFAGLANEKNEK